MNKEKIINIKLNYGERIEDNKTFLKYINVASKILNIKKNILKTYILYEGNLNEIIEGFEINEISKNYYKLTINENIKEKKGINKNALYNYVTYCCLNNFKTTYFYDNRYDNIKEIWSYNLNMFKKKVKFELNDGVFDAVFKIKLEKEKDIIPEGCCLDRLEDESEDKFYELEEYFDKKIENFRNYYYTPLKLNFTDNIKNNMNLIKNEIKKEYKYFISQLNEIKEHNKIYFKSQILKNKINDF